MKKNSKAKLIKDKIRALEAQRRKLMLERNAIDSMINKACDARRKVADLAQRAFDAEVRKAQKALDARMKADRVKVEKANKAKFAKSRDLMNKVMSLSKEVQILRAEEFAPPVKGAFICYKKVYTHVNGYRREVILTLEVPAGAKRFMGERASGNVKCRAEFAKVVKAEGQAFGLDKDARLFSGHDTSFFYKVGALAKPHGWSNGKVVCAGGIHFYMKRSAAERH